MRVVLPQRSECFRPFVEMGLDDDWTPKRRKFSEIAGKKGVYILYTKNPPDILYIGKTGGETMDFATRLHRHATESASRNSRVYKELERIKRKRKRIYAGLIDVERIKTFFSGKMTSDLGYTDIFEQIAIHFLNPRLQRYQE